MNGTSVYICMYRVVEYCASENVTPSPRTPSRCRFLSKSTAINTRDSCIPSHFLDGFSV